jgi:uncharacterized protein YggU (UPF0235/DUF167 family)
MDTANPWRPGQGGLLVNVRLTPKGGRDAIEGIVHRPGQGAFLAARVRAAAHEGAANAALESLLADALDVPKRSVRLVAGATARNKAVLISGDPEVLAAALARLLETRSAAA